MTKVSNIVSGGANYQALDPQAVLSQIAFGDIRNLLSTTEGDYADEKYTTSYINGLFNSYYEVADFLMDLVKQIRGYVVTFDSVDPPPFDTYLQELSFLDKVGSISATTNVSNELNIRSEPSTEGEIVGTLKNNDTVNIIDYTDDGKWAKIEGDNSKEAYVARDYLDVDLENQPSTSKKNHSQSEEASSLHEPAQPETPESKAPDEEEIIE